MIYPYLYSAMRLLSPGGLSRRGNLGELERTQWLSGPELEKVRFERIRKVVRYAFENVPYYHERYKREGIHPEDIKTYSDFEALPFLTKEDVGNHLNDLVSREFRGRLYLSQTGGSTGKATRFFTENQSSNWGGTILVRGRGWYGVPEGAKMAWVWGAMRDIEDGRWAQRLKARTKRHRYLNAFSMTKESMEDFAVMLTRWKPDMIRAYPSALQIFASFVREEGTHGISPKFVETTAEKLTASQRTLFEDVFHCPVADCYSSRELYEMAYQCPQGGQHVCETVYLEIVADGRVVPVGRPGEVVATSLTKFGMPFIRYRIEDMAAYDPRSCPCGRGLPVLRDIAGRSSSFIAIPDGRLIDGGFFELLLSGKPEVRQFQVHQKDALHIDVNLVCNDHISSGWLNVVERELRERVGEDVAINIRIVERITLSPAGKHHYIISDLQHILSSTGSEPLATHPKADSKGSWEGTG